MVIYVSIEMKQLLHSGLGIQTVGNQASVEQTFHLQSTKYKNKILKFWNRNEGSVVTISCFINLYATIDGMIDYK